MSHHTNSTRPYGRCDTFFVEGPDNGVFAARTDSHEYAKLIARQRQEMMANELSRQASDDYLEDILKHMKQMEVNIPGLLI
jgi:hypothetical protein